MLIEQMSSRIKNALEETERLRAEGERLEAVGEALRDDMQTVIRRVTAMAEALEEAQAEADKYYQLWQSVVSHCNTVADERDRLRDANEALKVVISKWYSVYTDDMQPDGDLLADTDAALRGEGEK